MAHIRIWSWSKVPSRPRLAAVLRKYLSESLADAAARADSLLDGGTIDVGRLEANSLVPFKEELSALGANAEIEM